MGLPVMYLTVKAAPPRASLSALVKILPVNGNVLLNSAPEKIVYVSCNPATQARDIHLLDGDYAVEKVQPVDMFPHTHHVENVVLLKRKK